MSILVWCNYCLVCFNKKVTVFRYILLRTVLTSQIGFRNVSSSDLSAVNSSVFIYGM